MQTIRKIIFYIFLIFYIILCPLLILYSLGYIVNPAKKELTHSGLVYLSTLPSGANVYLEKSRYENNTPTTISGLLPGVYKMKLELKGYNQWSHAVSIEAGKATAFERIVLIPNKWKTQELLKESYLKLIPLSDKDMFLVAKGGNVGTYFVYDCKKNKEMPLLAPSSPLFNFSVISVFTEEASDTIIIYCGSLLSRKYLRIKPSIEGSDITDISDFFQEKSDIIKWNPYDSSGIFMAVNNYINYADAGSAVNSPRYFENVKGFGLTPDWLYVLDSQNIISKYSFDKKSKAVVFKDEELGSELFREPDFYNIILLDNAGAVFLSTKGQLITTRPPYHIISKGVKGINFLKDKQQLLYWTKDSINIIDFTVDNTTEQLFSNTIKHFVVYNQGQDIRQCFWAYNGSHIVFLDKDNIYLLELEPDLVNHVESVRHVQVDTDMFYSDDTGCAYYLGEKGSALEKVEIISK